MSAPIKAWLVSNGEWWELLHGETRGKVRSEAAGLFSGGNDDTGDNFLYFRATRFPEAVGRAFTLEDRREVDGEGEHDDNYISECNCVHCSPKSTEVSND